MFTDGFLTAENAARQLDPGLARGFRKFFKVAERRGKRQVNTVYGIRQTGGNLRERPEPGVDNRLARRTVCGNFCFRRLKFGWQGIAQKRFKLRERVPAQGVDGRSGGV